MRPITYFLFSAAALFLTAAAAAPTRAQSQQTQQPAASGTTASPTQDAVDPMVEAARKTRAKEQAEGKPKHVITNDDLPNNGAPVPATPAASADGDATANPDDAAQGKDKDSDDPKSEKYWHKRFADAHSKLAKAEQELDVLQRELNKNQVQYYPDPQKALMQQYTREDINEGAAKINVKKAEVDALRQHISDLEDELRKSGGDPGWAR